MCLYFNYTGQQNLIFFFVPRTSIDELSSTFYAEFRYVCRIYLSDRFSEIQRNLYMQNSTLGAHATGRNFPLKCRCVWLFAGISCPVHPSSVSSYSLPTYLRSTCLGTAFHSHNIWVKSFTVFITAFAKIFQEKIQV